jgi:hypothetical protein
MRRSSAILGCSLALLAIVSVLAGCISPFSEEYEDIIEVEEYPGLYLTNNMNALPLSTSGYDIYLIGEYHGQQEVHLLFIEYLKTLHETIGLRDVILEANQHAGEEANSYVLGESEEFPESLWNRPDRFDVLEKIREVNEELPDREKIRVHLVDVNFPLPQLYTHIVELAEEIGAEGIAIPSLEEFEKWDESMMMELVEKLEKLTEEESTLNELKTVRASIEYAPEKWKVAFDVREETIARNIHYVLRELDGAPVLALYGAYHACKTTSISPEDDTWTERLTDSGISVYSVTVTGISGQRWYDSPSPGIYEINELDRWFWLDEIPLDENATLEDIFDREPDYEILYLDLHINTNLKVPWQAGEACPAPVNTPLSDVYDGIILFREVHPSRVGKSAP